MVQDTVGKVIKTQRYSTNDMLTFALFCSVEFFKYIEQERGGAKEKPLRIKLNCNFIFHDFPLF